MLCKQSLNLLSRLLAFIRFPILEINYVYLHLSALNLRLTVSIKDLYNKSTLYINISMRCARWAVRSVHPTG